MSWGGSREPRSWLDRAATLWTVVNERLSDLGPRCSDYHLVSYEKLFDHEKSGLRALCDGLDVPFCGPGSAIDPKDPINHAQGRALPAWQAWSDSQIRALNQIAGPLMTRYGYGLEAEWQERVERAR